MTSILAGVGDLTGYGLDAVVAEALVAYLPRLVEETAATGIVLGGSRAFGLGNRYSDIDLVALLDRAPDRPVVPPPIADHSVHVSGMTPADVAAVADRFRIEHLPATSLTPTASRLVQSTRTFLELTDGPVLHGAEAVAAVRAGLPRDGVGALVVESHAALQGGVHRDAAGALASGDWATAVEATLIALDYAVQAAVAVHDDLYVPRKFLARRAQRHDAALFATFTGTRAELVSAGASGDTAADAVSRTLRRAAGISAGALLGWHPPDPVAAPGSLVRSAWHCVARYTDGYLITGATDNPVTRAGAEVWLAHDGRATGDVVALLTERWQRPVDTVRAVVEAAAGQLAVAGLLAPDVVASRVPQEA
ncbi:MAG TPA: nucleotidyltransferase domain-containing protein [Mycobacteriales bacterium]|nr:nucleotidyltransferase domain-containing protein [Mycobacteriales bacterium]